MTVCTVPVLFLGHYGVVELLIRLNANINAKDEDGDTALHIAVTKRMQMSGEVREEDSPGIYSIHNEFRDRFEDKPALSIASYLIQMGIDVDALNAKEQKALNLLDDVTLQELLENFKPVIENDQQVSLCNKYNCKKGKSTCSIEELTRNLL